ncbi:hypothetical protein Acsp02_01770 [Actinoplanes sp. NBRC 103695]|nr:hypothetical protein Acsp02_01770 [Actinoplanes sp. NBRC 103695]
MNHPDQLRQAMQAHEHLAPEPAVVYARVQELAKSYRRRRLIAQTAGGAVLGVAVITGAFQVPHLFPGETAPSGGTAVVQPAASPTAKAPAPSEEPEAPEAEDPMFTPAEQKARDKYFAEGYSLDEAEKLSKLWKMKDIDDVKTKAGQLLLNGKKLPVRPPASSVSSTAAEAQAEAFFAEGYDYDDAAELAKLWKLPTPYDAKVAAGKKILAGETLPIQP